jgi:hypothetical protein
MKRFRPKSLVVLVLALGVAGALAGCSADDKSASSGSYSGAVAPAMPPGADSAGKQEAAPSAPAAGNAKAQTQVGVQDRKLVRTARVTLTSPDVKGTVDQARQIAVTAGGYTGAEQTSSDSATLTLSIPVDKLDASLEQLATLPKTTVTRREQSAQDVTDQTVDVEARLATQRASVDRVRALLARATSVSEITSIEGELTSRESDLESLERRRDALAGSVAMSTVALSVSAAAAPPPAPADKSGGFLGGLSGGWDAFLTFGGGVLTVLGALAPFLIVIVPVGAVLWWLRKRRAPAPAVTPEVD